MKKVVCRVPKKVDDFLKKSAVKFELVNHKMVFTAFDKAATLRIKPALVGKVLVLKADKDLVMALIPGDRNLDFDKLQKAAKVKKISFVKEEIIKEKFKGVDPGAIPPLRELWGMPVLADRTLMGQTKIILSGGSYGWSIKMTPAAFKKITPDLTIGNFSKSKGKKPKPKNKTSKPALKKKK